MAKRDLAKELYRAYKTGQIKKRRDPIERGTKPGDPTLISETLSQLIADREWDSGIAEGSIFTSWPTLVGVDVAQHTEPISLLDGILLVQCSSTAWATQMQQMAHQLLATIRQSAPGALVDELRFIGPHTPSWKKGIRTIKNARGPRDTYG